MPWWDARWVDLVCFARCAPSFAPATLPCAHLDALAGERGFLGVGGGNVETHAAELVAVPGSKLNL